MLSSVTEVCPGPVLGAWCAFNSILTKLHEIGGITVISILQMEKLRFGETTHLINRDRFQTTWSVSRAHSNKSNINSS